MIRPPRRPPLFPYTPLFRSMRPDTAAPAEPAKDVAPAAPPDPRPSTPPVPDKPSNAPPSETDRKSTRLNSSHLVISYAVFCLKKKKTHSRRIRSDSTHNPLL